MTSTAEISDLGVRGPEETLETADSPIPAWRSYVLEQFTLQAQTAVLWWPVYVALGIGVFFSLPFDPPLLTGVIALSLGLVLRHIVRDIPVARFLCFVLALAVLGFTAAQVRTTRVAAPILTEEVGPGFVTGSVIRVEPLGSASRVTLDRLALEDVAPVAVPKQVRVRLPVSHGAPRIGERITVRAVLRPPGRPVAPGAFDFQRYSFFRQLGGVGFAVGRWQSVGAPEETSTTLADRITTMRAGVGERLATSLPGESGAVARALVTGERNAVPEVLQEAYRRAGLAHMLAISGLHMSLLAGLAFVVMRYGLALSLTVAERFNTKKLAAVVAIGAALFYLVLSGSNVPAQRAFIMVTVVLVAVLIDRTALSLRTLAWAAMAVLLLQPDALVGASFQLSFAAVIALISVYERVQVRARLRNEYGRFQPVKALLVYGLAVLLTDLIATSATGPFTAFHFHRVPSYSLLANFLAVPVMGLWIMPWGLFALILMPVGLESVALIPMGAGIDVVDGIARFVAGLPGSTWTIPPTQVWALVCIGLGGLILCLWQGHLRMFGVVPLSLGLLQPWLAEPPHVLVNETAEVLAVQGRDNRLVLSPGRREGFTRGVWLERWQKSDSSWDNAAGLYCDASGCLYAAKTRTVSLAFGEHAVTEDCGRVDVIIAKVPSWRLCKTDAIVIDRFDVWRHGAHAVWLNEDSVRVERVSDFTGRRIWNRPTWREPLNNKP